MSKATLGQFSFNRGELDPVLHGRSDWKYYYSGAEKLLNLVTRTQGGVVKRGGLRMVARAIEDSRPSVLIPFRFSVKQSYMLEFGHKKMRIIKDGGVVVYPAGHADAGREVVVTTPFLSSDLAELRFAQTSDVMILTHPGYAPRRLARYDHHDWRFTNLISNARTATPAGLGVVSSGGDGARYVVTAYTQAKGESPPSDAVTAEKEGSLEYKTAGKSFSELYDWLYQHDYSYIPDELDFRSMTPEEMVAFLRKCGYTDYAYGIRANGTGGTQWMHKKPDGTIFQTVDWWPNNHKQLVDECINACDKGWAGNAGANLQSWIDKYVKDYNASLTATHITRLAWNAVSGAGAYRVYREATVDGVSSFKLLGETTATTYLDDNFAVKAAGLPEENTLFAGVDDYPGVCAFFEQRLILARSNNKPTTFWGSDTGTYNSFSHHTPVQDSESYEFTLASGEMNEIHWVVPLNELLLGTSGGEWKAGGGSSAITPSNINARVQSWYGCSSLPPLVAGRTVIFTGRARRTIRSLSYSLEADGYSGTDLTAYASHLFTGRSIVGMCHQQEPAGIIWTVMSDGGLLSCTYAPEEDVVSWSRHETRGKFESCGSLVDMDGGDQVYFCVAREINGRTRRFIECMEDASDQVADESGGFFLDCGLTYRGGETSRITGLAHLDGEKVSCLADGNVFENLPVVDGVLELPDGFKASLVHVGLPYSAELVTLEMEPEAKETLRNRSRFAISGVVRFFKSRECQYSHTGGILSEMKFRTTELPGRPIQLFTGERNVTFTSPPGTRAVRLRFLSETPTPFTILGIIAEAAYGQPA